jgi:hypothetical protein
MNTIKIITLTSIIAALSAAPAMARGPGGGGGNGGGRMQGAQNSGVCPYGFEPGTGMGMGAGSGLCDGTGERQLLRDGSGKVAGKGNPNSMGTPLKDGSGKATAKGKGAKNGSGNRANCPLPAP